MKRILALFLTLALVGGMLAGCATSGGNADQLATVNGFVISKQALDERLAILELFFRQPMNDDVTKGQMVDQLIRERLLREQAEQMSITVDDAAVEAELAEFMGALDQQYPSRDELNAEMARLGLTNDTMASFMHNFLVGEEVVQRKMAEVTLSADELRAFYEQAKSQIYTFEEESVRAAHILVPLTEEETAKEIAEKAKAGGDFAELARLYSIDPGSGRLGGDLGYFTHGGMVPEFADAAFAMSVGEVSDPVRSAYGWHVIYLLDREAPGVLPFEKAEPDVTNRLLPEKQEMFVAQWMDSLEQAAKVTRSK